MIIKLYKNKIRDLVFKLISYLGKMATGQTAHKKHVKFQFDDSVQKRLQTFFQRPSSAKLVAATVGLISEANLGFDVVFLIRPYLGLDGGHVLPVAFTNCKTFFNESQLAAEQLTF